MREILFKARRKNWRELPKEEWWVEGYYMPRPNLPNKPRYYIVSVSVAKWHEIDPKTLCQYTGLKDKSGNRIWENDIVCCEHEKFQEGDAVELYPFPNTIKYTRNYAVEFINTGSSYGYRLRNKSIHFMLTGNVIYNHKIEVIGNIFDTPELLKGE